MNKSERENSVKRLLLKCQLEADDVFLERASLNLTMLKQGFLKTYMFLRVESVSYLNLSLRHFLCSFEGLLKYKFSLCLLADSLFWSLCSVTDYKPCVNQSGVRLNQELNWKRQISALKNKLSIKHYEYLILSSLTCTMQISLAT